MTYSLVCPISFRWRFAILTSYMLEPLTSYKPQKVVYDLFISWLFLFDSALDVSFVSLCAVKISNSRDGTWLDTANMVISGAPTMEKMAKLYSRGLKYFHFLPTRPSHTTGPSRFRATSHYKKCYSAGKRGWQRARTILSSTAGWREMKTERSAWLVL